MSLQKTMKALSDPTRREILQLLKTGKMSAGEIAERFVISAAAISRHLSVLKDAELVRDCRDGKFIFYEIDTSVLQDVYSWMSGLGGAKETDNSAELTPAPRSSEV